MQIKRKPFAAYPWCTCPVIADTRILNILCHSHGKSYLTALKARRLQQTVKGILDND